MLFRYNVGMIIESIPGKLAIDFMTEEYQDEISMKTRINNFLDGPRNLDTFYLSPGYFKDQKFENIFLQDVGTFTHYSMDNESTSLRYHIVINKTEDLKITRINLMFKERSMAREYFKRILEYFNISDIEIKNIKDCISPQYKI